jgi:hypothetical protein
MSVNTPDLVASYNPFCTMASGSGSSWFDQYDLTSNDDKYLTPNNVAEMTPECSHLAAPLCPAAMHFFNSPPEVPNNWGQVNPIHNDYHSNPNESSSIFLFPNNTGWEYQKEETHSKYTDLGTVADNILSIIRHRVGVEAIICLRRGFIRWRQSKATGWTPRV